MPYVPFMCLYEYMYHISSTILSHFFPLYVSDFYLVCEFVHISTTFKLVLCNFILRSI